MTNNERRLLVELAKAISEEGSPMRKLVRKVQREAICEEQKRRASLKRMLAAGEKT